MRRAKTPRPAGFSAENRRNPRRSADLFWDAKTSKAFSRPVNLSDMPEWQRTWGRSPTKCPISQGPLLYLNRFTPNELAQIDRRTGGGAQGGPTEKPLLSERLLKHSYFLRTQAGLDGNTLGAVSPRNGPFRRGPFYI